uniref:Si:ch211-172l8.4 n=1 Tax=Astyanax mexicanus TaxID=7994 RepID=A0A3B1KED0_ASTMX
MATVVPCASCYASSSVQPWGFFGRGPGGGYMSLLSYPGQRGTPKPRLAGHDPNLTLRQICHMLRVMRKVRRREAAAAAAAAKQASALGVPNSPTEKRCLPACFRRRRSNNLKRVS